MSTLLQNYFQGKWVAFEYYDDAGDLAHMLNIKMVAADEEWFVFENASGVAQALRLRAVEHIWIRDCDNPLKDSDGGE